MFPPLLSCHPCFLSLHFILFHNFLSSPLIYPQIHLSLSFLPCLESSLLLPFAPSFISSAFLFLSLLFLSLCLLYPSCLLSSCFLSFPLTLLRSPLLLNTLLSCPCTLSFLNSVSYFLLFFSSFPLPFFDFLILSSSLPSFLFLAISFSFLLPPFLLSFPSVPLISFHLLSSCSISAFLSSPLSLSTGKFAFPLLSPFFVRSHLSLGFSSLESLPVLCIPFLSSNSLPPCFFFSSLIPFIVSSRLIQFNLIYLYSPWFFCHLLLFPPPFSFPAFCCLICSLQHFVESVFISLFLFYLLLSCVCTYGNSRKANRNNTHCSHTHTHTHTHSATVSSALYLWCFDAGNQTGAHWLSSAMRGLILHYSQYWMNAQPCVWKKSSGQSAAACTPKSLLKSTRMHTHTHTHTTRTHTARQCWRALTHSSPPTKTADLVTYLRFWNMQACLFRGTGWAHSYSHDFMDRVCGAKTSTGRTNNYNNLKDVAWARTVLAIFPFSFLQIEHLIISGVRKMLLQKFAFPLWQTEKQIMPSDQLQLVGKINEKGI